MPALRRFLSEAKRVLAERSWRKADLANASIPFPVVDRPICLLVNPSAGGGRAGRLASAVAKELGERHRLDVRSQMTRDLNHAQEIARDASSRGELVAVLGGDGLIGAVADAIRDIEGALMAVLPGGRGNDMARVLGIPFDPLKACDVIVKGHGVPLDLGEIGGRAFVGIASVGFDSVANEIANKAPAFLGRLVYAYSALRALIAWRAVSFRIAVDGTERRFRGYSVAAANSKAYGGGMYVAPDAKLDDGQLDVVYLEDISKLRFIARVMPKAFKGTHLLEPSVHVLRGREIEIEADRPFNVFADGDPIGSLPAKIRALPAAVHVLVPSASPL